MTKDIRVKDLILGTMRSAKSAHLIMKGYTLDSQNKKVLTFKPETDTRDKEFVSSRALTDKRPAIVVPHDNDGSIIFNMIEEHNPSIILIDEIQFFTSEQVEKIALASIAYDIDIYSYGLLLSYTGKIFESVQKAIECGFRIKLLDMSCDLCDNNATHHLLYLDGILQTSGNPISVEDFSNKRQEYKSVCFNCYVSHINDQYNK